MQIPFLFSASPASSQVAAAISAGTNSIAGETCNKLCGGIWSLSSVGSHARPLPFGYQNVSEGVFGHVAVNRTSENLSFDSAQGGHLRWQLENANHSISIPARFPSAAHLDLLAAELIPDPNVGLDEFSTRWIIDENWTYTADLRPLLAHENGLCLETGYQQDGTPVHQAQETDYFLHFTALDTVTNISLSNQIVGQTFNSFRPHTFNVTSQLAPLVASLGFGQRYDSHMDWNLTLTFLSPRTYADEQSRREPFWPNQNTQPGGGETIDQYEYANRQFIRKQQSDFGWDWGPAYAPSGPIGDAFLVTLARAYSPIGSSRNKVSCSQATRGASLMSNYLVSGPPKRNAPAKSHRLWADLTGVDVHRLGQVPNMPPNQTAPWVVNITLDLWSTLSDPNPLLDWALLDNWTGHDWAQSNCSAVVSGKGLKLNKPIYAGRTEGLWVSFELPFAGHGAPELWWPKRLEEKGKPFLYDLWATLWVAGERLDWVRSQGFRTSVLNQLDVTVPEIKKGRTPGSNFHLEVNGVPIFVQGANFIPADTFTPRGEEATLFAAQTAEAMGLNLLRIWGGGKYETDTLYEWCDEHGILLWSELIFACAAAYPVLPNFLNEVEAEVQYQVRRLSSHSSTALWAGNNEGEQTMLRARAFLSNGSIYESMYEKLFNQRALQAVRQNTKGLSYLPASTGLGYTNLDPYVPRYKNLSSLVPGHIYGDAEYYSYDSNQAFNISAYPVSRFVNEFGMISLPSIYTLDTYAGSEDWDIDSPIVRAHNKHPPPGNLTYPFLPQEGQEHLTVAAKMYYPVPTPLCPAHRLSVKPSPNLSKDRCSTQRSFASSRVYDGQGIESTTLTPTLAPTISSASIRSSAPPACSSSDRSESARKYLRHASLAQWAYVTQVFQATFLASQTLVYRMGAGLGQRTLGAIFWQLNSIWQGSDWSVTEYGGRWKLAAYLQRAVMAPVAPFVTLDPGGERLDFWVMSDVVSGLETDADDQVKGVLHWQWYDYLGTPLTFQTCGHAENGTPGLVQTDQEVPFSLSGINSTLVFSLTSNTCTHEGGSILPSHVNPDNTFLHVLIEGTKGANRASFTNEIFWPWNNTLRRARIPHDPGVEVHVLPLPSAAAEEWTEFSGYSAHSDASSPSPVLRQTKHSGQHQHRYMYNVTCTRGVAPYFFLEHPDNVLGYFSNTQSDLSLGFFCRPGEVRTFVFNTLARRQDGQTPAPKQRSGPHAEGVEGFASAAAGKHYVSGVRWIQEGTESPYTLFSPSGLA